MSDLFDELPGVEEIPSRRQAGGLGVRRKRQHRSHNLRTAIVLTVLLGAIGFGGWYLVDQVRGQVANIFAAPDDYPGPGYDEVEIVIPPGATGTLMGAILYDADVVASQEAFTQAFRANPQAAGIQPGTYRLYTQMSASEAVVALVAGERVETNVTIPEGFIANQVFARIVEQTEITQADIDAALAEPASFGLPDVAEGNPEGWLFPATYRVEPSTTATDLLSQMVSRTIQELDALGVAPENREDILNKAALIEREVRFDAERPKVARAIFNRIDRGMPLQIDAAVAYGLGISGTQLTRAHLNDPENPFNTYQHLGLPPTPIANPGAASMEAAVNPADGPWIFWVTVNLATGETWFSETYEEHQRGVAELRAWQAANPDFGRAENPVGQADDGSDTGTEADE